MVCFSYPYFLPSHCPSIRCKISLFFHYGRMGRKKKKKTYQKLKNSVFRLGLSATSQHMSSKYRCIHQLLRAAAWPTLPAGPEAQPKAALGREKAGGQKCSKSSVLPTAFKQLFSFRLPALQCTLSVCLHYYLY